MSRREKVYPEKIVPAKAAFDRICRGDVIFIGSACAEPQHLVRELAEFSASRSVSLTRAGTPGLQRLGVAPYQKDVLARYFRANVFFAGVSVRDSVNRGDADYTPAFLYSVPRLFRTGVERVDVALVQASPPDARGDMSLGISVDIAKSVLECARFAIVQVNSFMPKVHGDTFINAADVDFIVEHDEPLLEYSADTDSEVARRIGIYVARLIEDGDTIQAGWGGIPDAVLSHLSGKAHLGVHSEMLGDSIIELMKRGVIDNSRKKIDRGKTVATFCMGTKPTYDFMNDNPAFEFRAIDYTNNPLTISRLGNLAAINSAMEIDLTGQATAESIGLQFYNGAGGQADFMRGAALAGGKRILAIPSTAHGDTISRIVPSLKQGAGATLVRGDIQYVVTEYGIAHLRGKSIRERAMDLIAIAHPRFQPWLIGEAKKAGFIYSDQAFIPGSRGRYPEHLETWRTARTGEPVLFRPVRISDEPLLTEFLYSLSEMSTYRRFISARMDMPHERVQELVIIDYTRETAIAAVVGSEERQRIVAVGRYNIDSETHTAEVAFAVRDDWQNRGLGTELLSYLTYLARRQGLLGFTADVLIDNEPMLHVFEKGGFEMQKRNIAGLSQLRMMFRE